MDRASRALVLDLPPGMPDTYASGPEHGNVAVSTLLRARRRRSKEEKVQSQQYLKLCEHLQLVTPGSVLAADNVIHPGNPPYLEYVRSDVKTKREKAQHGDVNGDDTAHFPEHSKNQYQKRQGEEKLSTEVKGNPNLVYKSKLVNSLEPTGEKVCPLTLPSP